MNNYYEILGVSKDASQDDIKKAYRKLSKQYHPDVNPDGAEKFKEIATAYDTIGDEAKRSQYDNRLNNPFGNTNGMSYEDLFAQMFGNQTQNPFGGRQNAAPDKIVKVQISPIESYKGIDKTIRYMKDNHCNLCNGSGGEQQKCGTCGGQGFQIKSFGTGFMVQQIRTACQTCAGRGYTLVHRCYSCDGKGVKSTAHEVNVKLPVRLIGSARGVLSGGRLMQVFRNLSCVGLPSAIPDAITLDISSLKIGLFLSFLTQLRLPSSLCA